MASHNLNEMKDSFTGNDTSVPVRGHFLSKGLQWLFGRLNVRQKISLASSLAISIAIVGGLTGRFIETSYKNQIRIQLGRDLERADYLTHINGVVWQAKAQQPRYGSYLASGQNFQKDVEEWRGKITEIDQRLTEFQDLLDRADYGSKYDTQELIKLCKSYKKSLQAYSQKMEGILKRIQTAQQKEQARKVAQSLIVFGNNSEAKNLKVLANQSESQARDLRSRAQAEFMAYEKAEKLGFGILMASFLVSIGLASLLIKYASKAIAKPIEMTTKIAQQVTSESNFELQAPVTTADEVGQLATSLNELIKRVREYTEELQETAYKAETANRAKSVFLANMSHELRTPLNAILGYSEMLQEEAEDLEAEELIPDLENIQTAGRHLLTMISDILDISKIEAGQVTIYLEEIDIDHLIQDVVITVQPLVSKNQNFLEVNCPSDLGVMHSDLTKVRQVLLNLISNAAKFTDEGKITLTAKREEEKPAIEHTKEDADLFLYPCSFIVFEVNDTGIGMSPEQIEQIFKPFTQADVSTTRKYGGTGLGLAISQRLCEMLNATLSVESEVGKGSTFKVRFPERVK
ncbi:ATP-binding protein [Ancylothrix sp. C2]|uniref:sensor histidine kinase n=1 Tax=Ancylothrix sp. D3o TaxID=2953691 RepID=UPI0021BBAE49|nr:ATP-binding protein [Ancylothrix sp. D3o]MCT7952138.1 ATP-binding protein [Ancylothrix sp. D3o]